MDEASFKATMAHLKQGQDKNNSNKNSMPLPAQSTSPSMSHTQSAAAPPRRIIKQIPLDFNKLKLAGLDRKLAEALSKHNAAATKHIASAATSTSSTAAAAADAACVAVAALPTATTAPTHAQLQQQQRQLASVSNRRKMPTNLVAVDNKQTLHIKALIKNKILSKSAQHSASVQQQQCVARIGSSPQVNPAAASTGFTLPIAKADLTARPKPPLLLNSVNKLPRHRATCGGMGRPQARRQQAPPQAAPPTAAMPPARASPPLIVLENKVLAPNEKIDLRALRLPTAPPPAALPSVALPPSKELRNTVNLNWSPEKLTEMAKEIRDKLQVNNATGTATKKVILNVNSLNVPREQLSQLAKELRKQTMQQAQQQSSNGIMPVHPVSSNITTTTSRTLPSSHQRTSLLAPVEETFKDSKANVRTYFAKHPTANLRSSFIAPVEEHSKDPKAAILKVFNEDSKAHLRTSLTAPVEELSKVSSINLRTALLASVEELPKDAKSNLSSSTSAPVEATSKDLTANLCTSFEETFKEPKAETTNCQVPFTAPVAAAATAASPAETQSSSSVLSAVDFIAQLTATNAMDSCSFMELSAEEMSMNAKFGFSQIVPPTSESREQTVQLPTAETSEQTVQLLTAESREQTVQLLTAESSEQKVQLPTAESSKQKVQLPTAEKSEQKVQLPTSESSVQKGQLPTRVKSKPEKELRIGMILPLLDMDILHATCNESNVLSISPNANKLENSVQIKAVANGKEGSSLKECETLKVIAPKHVYTNVSRANILSNSPTLLVTAPNEVVETEKLQAKLVKACAKEEEQPVKRATFRPKKGKINLVQRNKRINALKTNEKKSEETIDVPQMEISEKLMENEDKIINLQANESKHETDTAVETIIDNPVSEKSENNHLFDIDKTVICKQTETVAIEEKNLQVTHAIENVIKSVEHCNNVLDTTVETKLNLDIEESKEKIKNADLRVAETEIFEVNLTNVSKQVTTNKTEVDKEIKQSVRKKGTRKSVKEDCNLSLENKINESNLNTTSLTEESEDLLNNYENAAEKLVIVKRTETDADNTTTLTTEETLEEIQTTEETFEKAASIKETLEKTQSTEVTCGKMQAKEETCGKMQAKEETCEKMQAKEETCEKNSIEVQIKDVKEKDLTQLYYPPKMPKSKQKLLNNNDNKNDNNNDNNNELTNNENLPTVSLLDVLTQELPPPQGEAQLPFRSGVQEAKKTKPVKDTAAEALDIQNLLNHLAAENVVPQLKEEKPVETVKVPRKKLIKTRPVLTAKRSSKVNIQSSTKQTEAVHPRKRALLAENKTNGNHRISTSSTSDDDDVMFHGFDDEPSSSSRPLSQLKTSVTDISDDATPDYDETEEEPQLDAKKPKTETIGNKDKLDQHVVPNVPEVASSNLNMLSEVVTQLEVAKVSSEHTQPETQNKRKRSRRCSSKKKDDIEIEKMVETAQAKMETEPDLIATLSESLVPEQPVVKKRKGRQSRKSIIKATEIPKPNELNTTAAATTKDNQMEDPALIQTEQQVVEVQTDLALTKPKAKRQTKSKAKDEETQMNLSTTTAQQDVTSVNEDTPLSKPKRTRKSRSATPKLATAAETDAEIKPPARRCRKSKSTAAAVESTTVAVEFTSTVAASTPLAAATNSSSAAAPTSSTPLAAAASSSSAAAPSSSTPLAGSYTPAISTPDLLFTQTPKRRGRPFKVPEIMAKKLKTEDNAQHTQTAGNAVQDAAALDSNNWPPISGFNLRLLLIRKREQLDSDEELREEGRGEGALQCGLCLVRCSKTNWQTHLGEHYGIGWPIDQVPAFLTRATLINHMIAYLKAGNGSRRLSCRLCDRKLGSGLGVMLHLEGCGVKLRVECEACKKTYTQLSYPAHYRTCAKRIQQSEKDEECAEKTAVEEETSEIVFSNAGRAKRKSTLKAETKLGKIAAQLKKQDGDELCNTKDFEGDSSDYEMGADNESSEEYESEGVDSNEDAAKTEDDEPSSSKSSRKKTKKNTTLGRIPSLGNCKPLYGRMRGFDIVRERLKYFMKVNYTNSMLYAQLLPRFEQLLPADANKLLPSKESSSMRYAYDKVDDKAWLQLAPLEGFNKKFEHVCYLGQPIKELAWVPLPSSVKTQYLLCSQRSDMLKFTRLCKDKQDDALLLLLECKLPPAVDKNAWPLQTRLHYAISVPQGPVHTLAFMPSGGYDEASNRLALLAVGSSKSAVIYALPLQVQTDKAEERIVIVLQALITLSLDIDNPVQDPCTKICWSESSGHSLLVTGYASGHVAFWDIADEEGLNSIERHNQRHILPANYFYFGERTIRNLELHYDSNGARWLAIGATVRKLWVYDIANLSLPLPITGDTIYNLYLGCVTWPSLWESLVIGCTALYKSQVTRMVAFNPSAIYFGHGTVESLLTSPRAVHLNAEQLAMVTVTDNGDVAFTQSNQLNMETLNKKKTTDIRSVCATEACYLSGAAEPKSIEPDQFKQDYGLLLKPLTNMPNEKKSTYLNPKRMQSFDLRNMMRLNSVRWNWNAPARTWVALGAEHGLLRIINFESEKHFDRL